MRATMKLPTTSRMAFGSHIATLDRQRLLPRKSDQT